MSDKKKDFKKKGVVENDINRRDFLYGTGGAIGLTTAAALGLPAIASAKTEIEFARSSCGEGKDKPRVLVAYGSRAGSTGGIADAVGKQLCVAGAAVDVRLVKEVTDLDAYDAVVVGGPARAGKWLKDSRNFVNMHQEALSKLPVVYFMACLQVVPEQPQLDTKNSPANETIEQKRQRAKAYLDPLLKKVPRVKPIDIGIFAGALHFDKLKRPERTLLKSAGLVEGDFRKWDRIKSWTTDIAPALLM